MGQIPFVVFHQISTVENIFIVFNMMDEMCCTAKYLYLLSDLILKM